MLQITKSPITLKSLRIIFILLAAMLSHAAMALPLCAGDCELSIDFIEGGSIQAVEPLSITFGEGGLVNDGVVATGYAAGETLVLQAGESLEFGPGGQFNLGVNGNIDYTSMSLTVHGDLSLSSSTGAAVSLHGSSDFVVTGTLSVNSPLSLSANLDLSGANAAVVGSGEISLQPSAVLTTNAEQLVSGEQVTGFDISSVSLVTGGSTQANVTSNEPIVLTPDPGTLEIVVPTIELNADCASQDDDCAALADNTAQLSSTDSTAQSAGSIDGLSLFALFTLLLACRRRLSAYSQPSTV